MHLPERGILIHDLRGRLADDDEAHDNRAFAALVGEESLFGQAFDEAAGVRAACSM